MYKRKEIEMSYPLTPEGLAAIKVELDYLQRVKRPGIINAISEARAHGDLKENAEYHAAKEDQAMIEGRISQLDSVVKMAEVIDVTSYENKGRVIFGSTVTLENCDTEQRIKIRIVGELEADFSKGTVSSTAPLVKCCLGRDVGDTIEFQRGDEIIMYDIISVEYLGY